MWHVDYRDVWKITNKSNNCQFGWATQLHSGGKRTAHKYKSPFVRRRAKQTKTEINCGIILFFLDSLSSCYWWVIAGESYFFFHCFASLKWDEESATQSLTVFTFVISSFILVCSETQTTFDSGFNFRDIVDEGADFDFSSMDALEWVFHARGFMCDLFQFHTFNYRQAKHACKPSLSYASPSTWKQ